MKPKPFPSGREIAARSGWTILEGEGNRCFFWRRTITLTPDIFHGRDAVAVLVAAHELAHSRQPRWQHIARIFFYPLDWLMEADAWESATETLVEVSR